MLIVEEHLLNLEDVIARKEATAQERQRRTLEKKANKEQRAEAKKQTLQAKQVRSNLAQSMRKHKERWSLKNMKALGNKLHATV